MRAPLVFVLATAAVVGGGILVLVRGWPIGPAVLVLAILPLAGLTLVRDSLTGAVPDLVFGTIDTGLLAVPTLAGAVTFGVAGAVAGSAIGDALTDAVAGFFEGGVAQWLRRRGFDERREPVPTALGKMAGCLLGSGTVLTVALVFGIRVPA